MKRRVPRAQTVQLQGSVPFWRDERVLKIIFQIVFIALIILGCFAAVSNYLERGLTFSFSFLDEEASFDLAEGISFSPTDSFARAFLVGLVNTIRVAVIGIVLATVIGLVAGLARLSDNWLVSRIATVYIEIIRNTPLLVQLFFIYFAVILKLPSLNEAIVMPGPVFLSNRGLVFPWVRMAGSFGGWTFFLGAAVVGAVIMVRLRRKNIERIGRPGIHLLWVIGVLVVVPLIGWFLVPGKPLALDLPELITKSGGVLKVEGGRRFSSEFSALLFGLSIYTSSYIAELVRAGIQSVPKGQTEAAKAQGFTNGLILRLIILPQALRVMIPPMINQYLNLTKNSSLAIGIGFLDVYAVSQTMLNQSGRVVEVFLLIMAAYLSMSLIISFIMNQVNRRIQIVER